MRWRWLVRDRTGRVLAQNEGGASIQPLGAFQLDVIETPALDGDSEGLLLVELQLEGGRRGDSGGTRGAIRSRRFRYAIAGIARWH